MTGTLINAAAIIVGGGMGLLLAGRLSERLRQTVVAVLGLFTLMLGVQAFLQTRNVLVVLGSLVAGALLGEWWGVEEGMERLGRWLERRFARGADGAETGDAQQGLFLRGFLTASLLFCVGPVAILGPIENGVSGSFPLLAVKSILDGFAAMAFATSLGAGVLFSALPLLVYQGAISLAAVQMRPLISDLMMGEMTASGGVLLAAIAVSGVLEIKKIRTGSLLPALLIAPLLVFVLERLGVHWASLP